MQGRIAPTLVEQRHSGDGSIKFLWRLADGLTIESIYFTFRDQVYTCISSQVGCNVQCPFCETGKQNVQRNVTADEIYAQVALIQDIVCAVGGPLILDHVALAGMGEPLLNFEAVVEAASRLRTDGFTPTVSLSTSGIVPSIYRLAETVATSVNKLFLSLHASTDEVRNHLVPTNKKYPLKAVLEAAHYFYTIANEKVTATYLLFEGINDRETDLKRLMELLDPTVYIIQLSEWNPITGRAFTPSPSLECFRQHLSLAGYEVFIQRSKGRDIEGGCGQLRSRFIQTIPKH